MKKSKCRKPDLGRKTIVKQEQGPLPALGRSGPETSGSISERSIARAPAPVTRYGAGRAFLSSADSGQQKVGSGSPNVLDSGGLLACFQKSL